MCWCSQDYSGLMRDHTRCEGHVGEVLCHHLPEPRGRRSQKPPSASPEARPPASMFSQSVILLDHPSRKWGLEFLRGCAFPLGDDCGDG